MFNIFTAQIYLYCPADVTADCSEDCPARLTKTQFLSRVRGESEAQHCHGGDQETRHDQVEEVVESSPPDLDGEGDVQVWLRATLINNFISFSGDSLIKRILIVTEI